MPCPAASTITETCIPPLPLLLRPFYPQSIGPQGVATSHKVTICRKHHRAPREGKKIGVTCVFSREAVAPPDARALCQWIIAMGFLLDGQLSQREKKKLEQLEAMAELVKAGKVKESMDAFLSAIEATKAVTSHACGRGRKK